MFKECTVLMLFVAVGGALTANEISDEINNVIKEHKVTMFSKTYCPYSKRLKALLKNYDIEDLHIVELDTKGSDMSDMQDFLKTLTGRRTVPQLFVGGVFVGGSDDTREKEEKGELSKILADAGALTKRAKH